MAGSMGDDYSTEGSSVESLDNGQYFQSSEARSECRLSEQVDNGTPSTSPPYWDTEDDDDSGPNPSELYGRYTWQIAKFSQASKRELKSEIFNVGGYKWYILIYPQGCDVHDHLSLFLCVANHDKFRPGWGHCAQFTIAVVNKDPKMSKYSDTLHRFCKKEHDWGWKKFMELNKVHQGFIVDDTLEIRAQVQIIREKAHRPFRCLDRQYRRELVRVYLTNVEQICQNHVEQNRKILGELIDNKVKWLREKIDLFMTVLVKSLFVKKEVASTLVMDSLNSGLKALESESKSKEGKSSLLENVTPAPFILIEDDMFVLADDVVALIERVALEPLPSKDGKAPKNRTKLLGNIKEGNSGEYLHKHSIEQDERRLTELGRKTIETFVLAQIYIKKIEAAYKEDVALKRQDELIREEEAAMQAEIELKAKRRAAEKEKRAKKKLSKQKRNSGNGKDRRKDEKFDMQVQLKEIIEDNYSVQLELEQSIPDKEIALDTVSDISDTEDGCETVHVDIIDIEDRHVRSHVCDADTSEVCGSSSLPLENGNSGIGPSSMDDSSSTCSTDSFPSVTINGSCRRSSYSNGRIQKSPNRTKNQGSMETHQQLNRSCENNTPLHDPPMFGGNGGTVSRCSNLYEPELKTVLPSKNHVHETEKHFTKKDVQASSPLNLKNQLNNDKTYKQNTAAEGRSPSRNTMPSKSLPHGSVTSAQHSTRLTQNETAAKKETQLPTTVIISQPEVQKNIPSKPVKVSVNYLTSSYHPVSSRQPPSTAIAPTVSSDQTVLMVSTAMTAPTINIGQPAQTVSIAKPALMISTVQIDQKVSTVQMPSTISLPQLAPIVSTAQIAPIVSAAQAAPKASTVQMSSTVSMTQSVPITQRSSPRQSYTEALQAHIPGSLSSSGMASPLIYSQPSALALSPANSTVTHHALDTSGLTFGSLTPELLHNHGPPDINPHHPRHVIHSETRAQKALLDEFPHHDIINYLLDEEQLDNGATVPSVDDDTVLHNNLSHPLFFPNMVSTINGLYELQPMAYYTNADVIPYSVYGNGYFDGMFQNSWPPVAYSTDLCLVSDGYPFQVMESPNLSCGVGGYAVFQPSNEH